MHIHFRSRLLYHYRNKFNLTILLQPTKNNLQSFHSLKATTAMFESSRPPKAGKLLLVAKVMGIMGPRKQQGAKSGKVATGC
jgi:hypothetical protein